jgi:RNA ligase (TIGR02306 family)
MSEFKVEVKKVDSVTQHPNADRLDMVVVGGITCISNKLEDGSPRYKAGDYVVFIPESAVIPEYLLKRLGFWNDEKAKGMLSGSRGDRVKPAKLRGVISEGVIFGVDTGAKPSVSGRVVVNSKENTSIETEPYADISESLGITKYEPPIPTQMNGKIKDNHQYAWKFDVENGFKDKLHEQLFNVGDYVVITEKLHGTFCGIVITREDQGSLGFGPDNNILISSKGLLRLGLFLENTEENRNSNLYVRKVLEHLSDEGSYLNFLVNNLDKMNGTHAYLFGEIFGTGVQDLKYGLVEPELRFFVEIWEKCYENEDLVMFPCRDTVPVLYRGEWSPSLIEKYISGQDSINGVNIREGIVVMSDFPSDTKFKACKFVSDEYKTRKGGTEFN